MKDNALLIVLVLGGAALAWVLMKKKSAPQMTLAGAAPVASTTGSFRGIPLPSPGAKPTIIQQVGRGMTDTASLIAASGSAVKSLTDSFSTISGLLTPKTPSADPSGYSPTQDYNFDGMGAMSGADLTGSYSQDYNPGDSYGDSGNN